MERIQYPFSTKCIPLPRNEYYRVQLISKTEHFLKRLRWRTWFHLNPDVTINDRQTYGFKSRNNPPASPCLSTFENKLFDLIKSVDTNNYVNPFQKQLATETRKIQQRKSILVKADKLLYIYIYDGLHHNNRRIAEK